MNPLDLPLALLLAPACLSIGQAAEPQFYQASPGALIERSAPGSWNYAYNDPGAVLLHDGKLHMFNNGFDGWPTSSGIAHYTSIDGLEWKASSTGPVFEASKQNFEGFGLVVTSALVTPEGKWRLFVTQLQTQPGKGSAGSAFRMLEADQPDGEWQLIEHVLMPTGAAGTWDSSQISDPMVLPTESGYVMFYTGFDDKGVSRIGRAQSPDSLHWKRDPKPVLNPSAAWELGVLYPSVVRTKAGYGMVYRATGPRGSVRLGRAFSADGLHWTKAKTPVMAPDAIEGNSTVNITALIRHQDLWMLYVDAFVGGNFSLPYALSMEDDLFAGLR